ncbi:hypothetical protein BSKO_07593 [Bryopsis sp. KO-2023]|nr:hypothetical protein BSKO_07593 [Bryopsis sp. KO-2023]
MDVLVEPLELIVNELKQKWKEFNDEQPFLDVVMGFVHAVDWTEPWIIGLICTHVLLLVSVIVFRSRTTFQSLLFTAIVLVIYQAEQINKYLGQNWKSFAKQQYFDPSGFFITTMLSTPLLLILLVMLLCYIREAGTLLIDLKRKQFKREQKLRASEEKNQQGSSEDKKSK